LAASPTAVAASQTTTTVIIQAKITLPGDRVRLQASTVSASARRAIKMKRAINTRECKFADILIDKDNGLSA
jgi:hypothetical protein